MDYIRTRECTCGTRLCISRKPVQIDIKDICTSLFPKKPKDYVHALLVLVRRNHNNSGKRKRNCATSDCTVGWIKCASEGRMMHAFKSTTSRVLTKINFRQKEDSLHWWGIGSRRAHIPELHRAGDYSSNCERSIRVLDPEEDAITENAVQGDLHSIGTNSSQ